MRELRLLPAASVKQALRELTMEYTSRLGFSILQAKTQAKLEFQQLHGQLFRARREPQ